MPDARYPIGKFSFEGPLSDHQKAQFLDDIAQTPARLTNAVKGLSEQQLDTPYRDGGWTVRQLVHQCFDDERVVAVADRSPRQHGHVHDGMVCRDLKIRDRVAHVGGSFD